MDSVGGVRHGNGRAANACSAQNRRSRFFAFAFAAALVVSGALITATAGAASKPRTSVSLKASHRSSVSGRIKSSKASCVRHRAVRLQMRQGRRWVTVAKFKSSASGRFKRAVTGAGKYRVLVSATGSCAGGTSSNVKLSGGSSAAACHLGLTHDTYDGFHIAVPAGWELSTLRGEVEVARDVAADEAVVVWPAIQTSGLTAAHFFSSQLSAFESQSASEGRPITVTANHSQGGVPSVTFTAPVNGQTVQGYATVTTMQFKTQLSSSQLAFVAYWAPASAFAAETSTLAGLAACYGPEKATLYHVFQDQAFTYMMPPGWSVSNETQDALDLIDGHGDYVTFELVGGNQFNSPQSLINVFLGGDGFNPVNALWTQGTPSQQVQNGATQSSEYEEFTATWKGQAVHGLIFALTDVGIGFNTGVVRIVLSSAGAWNSVNGALIQMVGAIQHNFTQDLQEIQTLNQQWQNFSNQVSNFDDILNNQQLTQDPTTGIYYYAPYDAYDSEGPNGPGYYLNDQRLNIINRQ